MKLHLMNPHFRYGSSFFYTIQGNIVVCPDNHIHYILSGSASITLGGKTHLLEQDTLFYCPRGVIYKLDSLDQNLKLISLNFDLGQSECDDCKVRVPQPYGPDNLPSEDAALSGIAEADSLLSSPAFFYSATDYLPSVRRILEEFNRDMPYSRLLCSCMIKELLIRLHYIPQNISYDSRQTMKEILDYIEKNYARPLTNEMLAAQFGYHPNYLCRLFRANMPMSIQQYILSLRLSSAKSLISETSLSLLEISRQSGFQDYAYFSAYFKKRTGMSPSMYRKHSRFLM